MEVNIIKLYGDNSKEFAHAIYRPNKELIEEIRKIHKDLNLDNIHITKIENGFIVEIPDEDLNLKEITNVN